jgi:hypothetical protein
MYGCGVCVGFVMYRFLMCERCVYGGCFDNCEGVLVICVLVFTVFCIVCTVFLYCFIYVYSFLFLKFSQILIRTHYIGNMFRLIL